ncbi:hypothetical protein H4Q26_001913 [Puccinia striiformis f. sp. tritici PST-130]|nr:hypothetical protein H4Q26_001913 [Puccinia striiformis f. sp. tritici PST-130]
MDDQSVSALDADSSLDLSTLVISTTTPQQETTQPKQTKDEKVLSICKLLHTRPNKLTPNEFITHILESQDSKFATLRRLWAVDAGLKSTMSLVKTIRNELARSVIGREAWEEFIQEEAITILSKQAPPKGYYPNGSFQSSATVKDSFFYAHKKETRDAQLTSEHTPFLYNILLATLQNQHGPITRAMEKDVIVNNDIDPTEIPLDVDAVVYGKLLNGAEQLHKRFHRIVSTVCSIMAFAANRRANALQLTNSLQTMMQDLKTDCGSNIIHQSHKNGLSQRDFDMFTLMANNRDILDQFSKNQGPTITATVDFYLTGISKLQTHIRQNDASVNKFNKHF